MRDAAFIVAMKVGETLSITVEIEQGGLPMRAAVNFPLVRLDDGPVSAKAPLVPVDPALGAPIAPGKID